MNSKIIKLQNKLGKIREELSDLKNTTRAKRIRLNILYDSTLSELKKIEKKL